MFIFQKSRSFVLGPRGLTRGGKYKVNYRGISRYSPLGSSHGLLNSPISDISVTWGSAVAPFQLSLSFKREVVGLLLLYPCASFIVSG